jgi:hypothetical protein
VTYIREVIGDKTWNSPVPTPPYPDYTSGTSNNGGSSSIILTKLLGDNVAFTDNQHADKNFKAHSFKNFREAGTEAFLSRIYGGVHMRRACEKGFDQGTCIGNYVFNNLKFSK